MSDHSHHDHPHDHPHPTSETPVDAGSQALAEALLDGFRRERLMPHAGPLRAAHEPGDRVQVSYTDASGDSHTATVVLTEGPAD